MYLRTFCKYAHILEWTLLFLDLLFPCSDIGSLFLINLETYHLLHLRRYRKTWNIHVWNYSIAVTAISTDSPLITDQSRSSRHCWCRSQMRTNMFIPNFSCHEILICKVTLCNILIYPSFRNLIHFKRGRNCQTEFRAWRVKDQKLMTWLQTSFIHVRP